MGRSRHGHQSKHDKDMHRHGEDRDQADHDHDDFDIDIDFEMVVGGWGKWFPGDRDFGHKHWNRDDEFGCKSKELDFELDIDRKGKWLDIEVEIESFDIELKVDARYLQPDDTPVAAMMGGDGTAIGEHTLVDAGIFSRLIDLGSVTIAFGVTQFDSAAVASSEGFAFAAAETFADVSGADLVLIFSTTTTSGSERDGVYFATEISTTSFIAIDFEDFDFAEGQLTFYFDSAWSYIDGGGRMSKGPQVPDIEGNVAMLDVDAQVLAENTFVDVLSSVLTIEDQLSTVSALAVTAVG